MRNASQPNGGHPAPQGWKWTYRQVRPEPRQKGQIQEPIVVFKEQTTNPIHLFFHGGDRKLNKGSGSENMTKKECIPL